MTHVIKLRAGQDFIFVGETDEEYVELQVDGKSMLALIIPTGHLVTWNSDGEADDRTIEGWLIQ